jgi:hypothetical protein
MDFVYAPPVVNLSIESITEANTASVRKQSAEDFLGIVLHDSADAVFLNPKKLMYLNFDNLLVYALDDGSGIDCHWECGCCGVL